MPSTPDGSTRSAASNRSPKPNIPSTVFVIRRRVTMSPIECNFRQSRLPFIGGIAEYVRNFRHGPSREFSMQFDFRLFS